MDLTPYVESLRRDLATAAETAGPELRAAVERLAYALDPAARLALMEAVSQAAAEITAEMPTGGVDVRLDGRELAFVVEGPAPPAPPAPPVPPVPPAPPEPEEGGLARITLRLPEGVKARAEDAAAEAGQSLNTWLVAAVRTATSTAHRAGDDAPRVDLDLPGPDPFRRSGRRMTGWV